MTDDESFVRALCERPDDETTRLVYADWLDDRADPRAEYLRTEAAWVALQPSDEQYRPLYRRVSQLAAQLDPEWFTAVSRTADLVHRAWQALPDELRGRGPSTLNLPRLWRENIGPLRGALAEAFGPDQALRRFCPPVDFVGLMCSAGGWRYSAPDLIEVAQEHAFGFGRDRSGVGPRTADPEMWLQFCDTGASWFFVCCDLASPCFGVVAQGLGDHPWLVGSAALPLHAGRNILQFLSEYVPATNRDVSHPPFDWWSIS
jgi:uncharacterized protein (TIGR02996 family)